MFQAFTYGKLSGRAFYRQELRHGAMCAATYVPVDTPPMGVGGVGASDEGPSESVRRPMDTLETDVFADLRDL